MSGLLIYENSEIQADRHDVDVGVYIVAHGWDRQYQELSYRLWFEYKTHFIALNEQERADHYDAFNRLRDDLTERNRKKLEAHFTWQMQEVLENVPQAPDSFLALDALKPISQERLTETMIELYAYTGNAVEKTFLGELQEKGYEIPETKALVDWEQSARSYMQAEGARKVQGIDPFIWNQLFNEMRDSYANNEDIERLRQRIEGLYLKQIIPNRSEVIARTETGAYSNFASLNVANQSRVISVKEWVSVGGDRTRSPSDRYGGSAFNHLAADGQKKNMNEAFEVSGELLRYPGDTGLGASAGNVINCRCTLVYEPKDDDAKNAEFDRLLREKMAEIDAAFAPYVKSLNEIDNISKKLKELEDEYTELIRFDSSVPLHLSIARQDEIKKEIAALRKRKDTDPDLRDALFRVNADISKLYEHYGINLFRDGVDIRQGRPREPFELTYTRADQTNKTNTISAARWFSAMVKTDHIDIDDYHKTIKFSFKQGARAFYQDTGEGNPFIQMGNPPRDRTYIHELGHWLDYTNPAVFEFTNRFLQRRGPDAGEELRKLSDITGHKAYSDYEVAYEDSFISPYVGKLYNSGSNEITSMGLEYMFSNPLWFYQKDREHFELMIAVMNGWY